jgi:hypothetical protein
MAQGLCYDSQATTGICLLPFDAEEERHCRDTKAPRPIMRMPLWLRSEATQLRAVRRGGENPLPGLELIARLFLGRPLALPRERPGHSALLFRCPVGFHLHQFSCRLFTKSVSRKQLIRGFVQVLVGALRVGQMSNQISGRLVNVNAFYVVELLSLEVEDSRAPDNRDMSATAVEDVSVHSFPLRLQPEFDLILNSHCHAASR